MKVIEAINRIDAQKHNTYSMDDKIAWLSRVDWMVKKHLVDTHECTEEIAFNGYNSKTDMNTVLLVPEPFDELYMRWMEAQIDYANGEYDKYNNAILMYQAAYDGYAKHYNQTHVPKGKRFVYF